MQNDIIPQLRDSQRGSIRPPVRPVVPQPARVPSREVARPTRSIDGMTMRETIVTETVVVTAPDHSQTVTQTVSDTTVVSDGMTTAAASAEKPQRKFFDLKRWGLVAAAIVVLSLTGYVSLDTWLTNSKLSNETKVSAQSGEPSTTWTVEQEGRDETKIPSSSLSSYTVAPDLPRALYIDKLNIAARVLPMSVNTAGSIQAPINIYDSGWYNGSVKPGDTGAAFIDGHASGPTREGLFAYLDTLKEGDTLQVEKGDGSKLTYKVVHTDVVPLADLDMKNVLLPYNGVTKGLNIMTCTGKWLPREKTYDHRVVVYTQQI
jgi:LPXTG-site transpeptidase (sortase) family protein